MFLCYFIISVKRCDSYLSSRYYKQKKEREKSRYNLVDYTCEVMRLAEKFSIVLSRPIAVNHFGFLRKLDVVRRSSSIIIRYY